MENVFVYGTLKLDQSNNHLLRTSKFIGQGMTIRPYYMASVGGFPVVMHEPPKHNVSGELFEVDEATLAHLDRLEGHPSWYCREETLVDIPTIGSQISAWMYIGVPSMWDGIANLPEVKPNTIGAYSWTR